MLPLPLWNLTAELPGSAVPRKQKILNIFQIVCVRLLHALMMGIFIYGRCKSAVAKLNTSDINTGPTRSMHYFPLYFVKYLPYREVS
jgi:hypothetical protein